MFDGKMAMQVLRAATCSRFPILVHDAYAHCEMAPRVSRTNSTTLQNSASSIFQYTAQDALYSASLNHIWYSGLRCPFFTIRRATRSSNHELRLHG